MQRLRLGGDAESAADGARSVRIFFDPGTYHSAHAGDLAALMVTLHRLRERWPSAALSVQTLEPGCIQSLDPAALCIDAQGARSWSAEATLAEHSQQRPRSVALALEVCRWIKRRQPWLTRTLGNATLRTARRSTRLLDQYCDAVGNAHLVLLSGASFNDACKVDTLIRLETLELAHRSGAATALLGQALGPMRDAVLRARAAQVLPCVDFMALRDGLGSLAVLDSLGAHPRELAITGDDAVVLGYQARRPELGSGIGVNLRVTNTSRHGSTLLQNIGATVREAAGALRAPLLPIAVARRCETDALHRARQPLRSGCTFSLSPDSAAPAQVLERLQRCRVVVVANPHAAVLALSMGIPAVMLASCEQSLQMLRGVAHQFGVGGEVLQTSQPALRSRLRRAIEAAWTTATSAREPLLAVARRQITASEAAYRRLGEIVTLRLH